MASAIGGRVTRSFVLVTAVLVGALAAGCRTGGDAKGCGGCGEMAGPKVTASEGAPTSIATINSMCPIGGDEFNNTSHDAELSRNHKGKMIGFCCEGCVVRFDGMDEAGKDGILKLAEANKTR